MAETKIHNSQIKQQPAMFGAWKTANQETVTTGAVTVVLWDSVSEYMNTSHFSVANNSFTAPGNGWLEISITLSIIGGSGTDDSMLWGIYLNGVAHRLGSDNWNNNTTAGTEITTALTAAFAVSSGDIIDVRYSYTQKAQTIMRNRSFFNGRFTPNLG